MSENKNMDWKAIFESFRKSNLPASKWCREHDINYYAFTYWHNKLYGPIRPTKKNKVNKTLSTKWIKAESSSLSKNIPATKMKESDLLIQMGKASIQVTSECDRTLLREVLHTLSSLC